MEAFDDILPEEPQQPAAAEPVVPEPEPVTPEPQPTPGRRRSPFADSPYVTEHRPQPSAPPKKAKKEKAPRRASVRTALILAAAVLLVAGSCLVTALSVNAYWEERSEDTVELLTDRIEDLQEQIEANAANRIIGASPTDDTAMTPAQLYAACADSVVAIVTTAESTGYYSAGSGSGSGFILSEDGYVITNYHVVEAASEIHVVTRDGTEYEATVKGHDSTTDLAVLKIDAAGLRPVTLGKSTALNIGDMVAAIGNPLGTLASTQTVGYISGIDREISTGSLNTITMIQTDCAINPGNSGGPLFNMRGEVIGITTAKYSGTTSSGVSIEGIGFAIPIDDVEPLIAQLIDQGYISSAYLGITVVNTDAESAAMFGLPTGAYVQTVEDGSCAKEAGLQPKDIIIALGPHEVRNVSDLHKALRRFQSGDSTTITVIRSGREVSLEVTLDERPADLDSRTADVPSDSYGSMDEFYEYFRRYFGG